MTICMYMKLEWGWRSDGRTRAMPRASRPARDSIALFQRVKREGAVNVVVVASAATVKGAGPFSISERGSKKNGTMMVAMVNDVHGMLDEGCVDCVVVDGILHDGCTTRVELAEEDVTYRSRACYSRKF